MRCGRGRPARDGKKRGGNRRSSRPRPPVFRWHARAVEARLALRRRQRSCARSGRTQSVDATLSSRSCPGRGGGSSAERAFWRVLSRSSAPAGAGVCRAGGPLVPRCPERHRSISGYTPAPLRGFKKERGGGWAGALRWLARAVGARPVLRRRQRSCARGGRWG